MNDDRWSRGIAISNSKYIGRGINNWTEGSNIYAQKLERFV